MILILDYGNGNLQSVFNAFRALDCDVRISDNPCDMKVASHVVLPGVGAFEQCSVALRQDRMLEHLEQEVLEKGKPFLGICVGLQVLASFGLEFGRHKGLGWIPGTTARIDTNDSQLRLPHIGWNDVRVHKPTPLFKGIDSGTAFYFVHSYHLIPDDEASISATCDYGTSVTASVQKENLFGVQFHPEKSQSAGIKLLENFISIN